MDYNNNYNNPNADGCMDWDEEVSQDSSYTLLPEGDYPFTVLRVERARYTPGERSKLPACNMAKVTLSVAGQEIEENFPLHRKMEWKICQLYGSIGMRQKGEPIKMAWSSIAGKSGILRLSVEEWQRRDGGTGHSNRVQKFYCPWDEDYQQANQNISSALASTSGGGGPFAKQMVEGAFPQPVQTSLYNGQPNHWQAGKF